YIVITDYDAMFLSPDYGRRVAQVIEDNKDYSLIGCITNRVGDPKNCYQGKFSDNMNMRHHYNIANEAWEKYGTAIVQRTIVAGFCMIFQKKMWLKVGGFKEWSYTFDVDFSTKILRNRGKVGIAKGLYM